MIQLKRYLLVAALIAVGQVSAAAQTRPSPSLGAAKADSIGALTPALHEAQGGYFNINNPTYVYGDFFSNRSGDPSLYISVFVTGTPTTGESPGLTPKLGGSTLPNIVAPMTTGDTNTQAALKICTALTAAYAANTNSLKTILNAQLDAYGHGFGDLVQGSDCSVNMGVASFRMDWPWKGSDNALTAVSTANTTVQICSAQTDWTVSCDTPKMDGNPVGRVDRNYPLGYVPSANDQLGRFSLGWAVSTPAGFSDFFTLLPLWSSTTGGDTAFQNLGSVSGYGTKFSIGDGLFTPGATDHGLDTIASVTGYLPTLYGGTAAGSDIVIKASSHGSPSGDVATLSATDIRLQGHSGAFTTIYLGEIGQSPAQIVLSGTASGFLILQGPSAASSGTLTFPNTTGTLAIDNAVVATSCSGRASGSLWNDAGTPKICP